MAAFDDTAARLDALSALLTTELPTRIVTRELKHFTDHDETDLTTGVVTLVAANEAGYKNQKGMVTKEGVTRVLLVAHLRVADNQTAADVQAAELTLLQEVKTALQKSVFGLSLGLARVDLSRQLDTPYGWFVAHVDILPPRASIQ